MRRGQDAPREPRPRRRPADAVRAADGGVHGEAHPEEPCQFQPPRLAEPQRRHRPHPPRRQEQGTRIERGARCEHSHPDLRRRVARRILRALRRRPHRHRLHRSRAAHPRRHRVREGRASRRRRHQALPALPRRDPRALPRRDARPAAVRPRRQGLRRAPAHRPDALAQARRSIDARPHRPAPVRGDAARLHRPTPPRPRRVGTPRHRAPPGTTCDARRRDLVARGSKESLDSCLFRRSAHRQTPPPQARVRSHRGHRHHPALRRCRGPRLLGLLPELRALRPRPVWRICCGRDYVAERRRPCARQENWPILRNIFFRLPSVCHGPVSDHKETRSCSRNSSPVAQP